MKLVVGLGNPGRQYAGTRHNAGYMLIDALASRLGWVPRADDFDRLARTKFDGLVLDGTAPLAGGRSDKLLLLKPTTFMNLSGRSVQAAMAFYQVAVSDVLVVMDDLALATGRLRLRASGSAGGHNGLKDIERALGTRQYARLRMGIDGPPRPGAQKDYVLGAFNVAQREKLNEAIDKGVDAVMVWMDKGIAAAMNQFNAGEDSNGSSDSSERPGK
jgi:peptidyl-tRNA hydrolase, PTH1 family